MKKIKKHTLLERAMRDYPAGTVFISATSGHECVSTGIFSLSEFLSVRCEPERNHVFSGLTEQWAKIVKEEKPKAIQVKNEQEFRLLMDHFDSKDWVQSKKFPHYGFGSTHHIFEYKDYYQRIDESNIIATLQYDVVTFEQFAAEKGIKVGIFIMTSEDGINLYGGMEMYGVTLNPSLKIWELNRYHVKEGLPFVLTDAKCDADQDFPYITTPSRNKAFSTKEAAEAWIAEQNSPKYVMTSEDGEKLYVGDTSWVPQLDEDDELSGQVLDFSVYETSKTDTSIRFKSKKLAEEWVDKHMAIYLFQDSENPCKVTKNGFGAETGKRRIDINYTGEELEQIWNAYQSLKGKEAKGE